MAIAVAKHSPSQLILASRTKSRIEEVISKIKESGSSAPVKPVVVNLSDQDSIREAAKEISSLAPRIDILLNNAAVNVQDYQTTKEGIELHFGTNHIGLFLLTNLLLENIRNAARNSSSKGSTRIVNVTSAGHRLSPIRWSDWNFKLPPDQLPESERPPPGLPAMFYDYKQPYSTFLAYGQCKTANILFSLYLNKYLQSEGILSYSTHPGCEFSFRVSWFECILLTLCSNMDGLVEKSRSRSPKDDPRHGEVLEKSRPGSCNNFGSSFRPCIEW